MGYSLRNHLIKTARILLGAGLIQLSSTPASTQPADSNTVKGADSGYAVVNKADSLSIDGLVIDKESGAFPAQTPIVVFVDSLMCTPDSTGSFGARMLRQAYHIVKVQAQGFAPFAVVVQTAPGKNNYFVTCGLEKSSSPAPLPAAEATIGPGWTISGCVADSRLDLSVKSDSARLEFDKQYVPLSKKGSFTIETKTGGAHTFHLKIPGYHEIYQNILLDPKAPQPFVVIHTTKLNYIVSRREITVSAKRQPVHITSTVAETKIPREQLKGTPATTSDPLQVLATLPSVASQSDVSARPIVRGGDVLESRIFLDGVTLLQPYHYGGIRSTFNQSAISNLTIYKSGFPAEYPNAQSAIISATSRLPTEEPLSLDMDVNMMQYSAYLGVPVGKSRTVGLNASAQGSYMDFMTKAVMKGVAGVSGDKRMQNGVDEYISTVNLPDYRDYSLGVGIKPNDRLTLFVNEVYNTDWIKFTNRDSMEATVYRYPDRTTQTVHRYWPANPNFSLGLGNINEYPHPGWDSLWSQGKSIVIDTFMTYKSNYNNLYGTAKYLLSNDQVVFLAGAWQKRWWDLAFPRAFSEYIPNARYDVAIDQYNLSGSWLYTGEANHVVKAGLNLDYLKAKYNVYSPRLIHELITKGNTNIEDHWGPVTGDSGFTINESDSGNHIFTVGDMVSRLLVDYNGFRKYVSGGIFGQDEWSVTPRLTLDMGARIEASMADTSVTVSPRVSAKFNLRDNIELLGAVGHYTQNNYEVAALALSSSLKPEKVWHASVGSEVRLLPWLTDKADFYGKYYYDLVSENVTQRTITAERFASFMDSSLRAHYGNTAFDSIQRAGGYDNLARAFLMSNAVYESHYTNDGAGYSLGFENFLRYDPTSFWYGWISFSLGTSVRQRHPGWRRYPFSLDRPLLISLVNYYRLPRKYELGVKYRYMSGIPYTPVEYENGLRVGLSNSRRYKPYQRLDMRISKGFNLFKSRGNFYIEVWNAFNSPNTILRDSKTNDIQSGDLNIPLTVLFLGLDFSL
jgi:hypothetical protein